MVGIILASHGGFAEGIHQSAEMIFGPQAEFESCILKPDEGPDDIKRKLNEAVASFDDQTEILFLVDITDWDDGLRYFFSRFNCKTMAQSFND